jgi:sugar phosphate isomerase/epimerase
MENLGLQLYSIKELTEKDFIGTLKKVAEIGYDGVEFAGFFDTPAKELKKTLDDLYLAPCGSHTGIDLLQNEFNKVIEYNLEIENPYIVCPGLPTHMRDSADAYKRLADEFNEIGQRCKEHGIQFAYHNHDFEFEKFNGEYGLDILLSNTQRDLVHMELDTFWVEYCGLRSIDFIKKYREQCSSLIHIKDLKSMDQKISTEIGKGIMNFKEIIQLGKEIGIKWYIVEQEEFEIPQLESIQQSLEYMRSIL